MTTVWVIMPIKGVTMYSYIKGTLTELLEDAIVVENQGIGYRILVSGQVFDVLPSIGEEVKVYTYTYVREDQLALFGFLTRDDLSVFQLLIGISGIGPKGALAVLSAMSADDLRFAVLGDDAKAIERVPGIGKKTAQRLLIELKDKFSLEETFEHASQVTEQNAETTGKNDLRSEAIMALTALGYGAQEATKAVRSVPQELQTDVETILKEALKQMAFI